MRHNCVLYGIVVPGTDFVARQRQWHATTAAEIPTGFPKPLILKTGRILSMHQSILSLLLVMLFSAGCARNTQQNETTRQSVLRLAVTTSTRDSGLLDLLVPVFEKQRGVRVDIVAVGTGAALRLGEAGDVDVVLVHAREDEDAFMAAGHGVRREDVMYNTFEILGPPDDPAGIRDMEPSAALRSIAANGQRFVSRGDESGTHKREKQLWVDAEGRPQWEGYVESGQGMGATLTMADQMRAYVLSDRGTFLKFKKKVGLVPLVTSSESLRNPYGIIVVNPQKHPSIHGPLAQAFVDFMISNDAQRLICDYQVEGEQLFYPLRLFNEN